MEYTEVYIPKDQIVKELKSSKETPKKAVLTDTFIKVNGKQIY